MNIPDGRTVNFFTTRGMLSAPSALTVNGIATVTISSAQAGSAVINAVGIDQTESPSNQLNIKFRAVMPSAMLLQAMPTTLGVNAAGSTAQQSVITAIVQDVNGNLVEGREGPFFPYGYHWWHDFSCRCSHGRSWSSQHCIHRQRRTECPEWRHYRCHSHGAVTGQVSLTVAQQALFVTLGTGNLILTPSNTQFALPYSVLVTDANGNPVTNATVELTILPTQYSKGIYAQVCPPGAGWFQQVSVPLCDNEDINSNGILDRTPIDEDVNGNNKLDPGNVATGSVPGGRVTTDASGFAFFNVVYAREFATWVEVALKARATVAGSEGLSQAKFFLRGWRVTMRQTVLRHLPES